LIYCDLKFILVLMNVLQTIIYCSEVSIKASLNFLKTSKLPLDYLFFSVFQDLAHRLLVSFLSELMASRGDEVMLLPELEEQLGVREELIRRHVPFSQRERKAGCRNFFWKTFTSC
uniref:Somatostatin/Cortistatin C-terminal domain-containing protein n=1 Tax=Sphaeramia orbicularis TaxID=375764 RepID=A0A673CZN9_9TELE